MKVNVKKGMVGACLWMGVVFLVSCSDGGGGGGDNNINGVWQCMSLDVCDGLSHTYYTDRYVEITDGGLRTYQCYRGTGSVCYYCPEYDGAWSGSLDTGNISVHEETMTLTVNNHKTCPMTMTLERASQTDIQNVLENCDMITAEEEW